MIFFGDDHYFFFNTFVQVLDTSKKHEFVLGSDTVGVYSCRATVRGYKEIRAEARVLMFGPPKILDNSDTNVDTRLGAEAVMTCDSFALPLPNNVSNAIMDKNL